MTPETLVTPVPAQSEKVAPVARKLVPLPEKPVVTIEPQRNWRVLDLRDLWAYRELLYFLIWRDVKVRYKQTVLGVTWVLFQPLIMIVIFSFIFGRVAGLPSDGIPYPLFAYAGVLSWSFFSSALTKSGHSLVGSAHLITKIYFPRVMVPIAAVCTAVFDLIFGLVLLVPLMIYYRITPQWHILMMLPLFLLLMLLALGLGMVMSALNVKYRDVGFALPFITQIWMFLSPVIYPASALPPRFRVVMIFNPVSGIIEGIRSAMFGLPFNTFAILISGVITLVILVSAVFWFRRMEREFADVI